MRSLEVLLERLLNDRFTEGEHEASSAYIDGWNAASRNAEAIVKRWANERRVIDALAELERNAP